MSICDNVERAFPMEYEHDGQGGTVVQFGMSLRDYFAAKALQALANRSPALLEPSRWAEHAYQVADLMLEERAK